MKAGAEIHFLAGQFFTLGVAAIAVLPRMPTCNESSSSFPGGTLSNPFRRAILALIAIGTVRVLGCHLHHPDSTVLAVIDGILGTIHVIGQSFLCLTTAYLLQCQLATVIRIEEGRDLLPTLALVAGLSVVGSVLSWLLHPNFSCLINLAEAVSCGPVIKTLSTYASVTTAGGRRGSVITQIVTIVEYWYLITSCMAFVAELVDNIHGDVDKAEGHPIRLILEAIRQNQDNGVDDWSRLLVHSIFLNSLDELQHFSQSCENGSGSGEQNSQENAEVSAPIGGITSIVQRRKGSEKGYEEI